MNKEEALKLALEALKDLLDQTEPPPDTNCSCHICPPCNDCVDYSGVRYAIEQANKTITAIKEALAQPEQDDRRLQIAMRQWEDWKAYALELQKKLVKYEGGSPMILNTQSQEKNT